MNDMTTPASGPLGQISKYFQTLGPIKDELGAGIQASFGIIGYKGKVWSLRYRGENKPLMRKDGDGPQSSIEVVIVKTPEHLSKIYYASGYVEGSAAAPDCFSNNGIVPDNSAPHKQNDVCATCKQNAWGSRVMQNAGTGRTSSGKACSDSKRLAVVPLNDLQNEALGGPMLLRVPPASLQDLALFGSALTKHGYPPCAVATRISFDPKEAYPKFNFQAIRALNDEEAQQIIEIQKRPTVERILAETGNGTAETVDAIPEQAKTSIFEQPSEARAPEKRSEPLRMREPNPSSEPSSGRAPETQSEPEIRANPENRQEVTFESKPPAAVESALDDMLSKLIPSK